GDANDRDRERERAQDEPGHEEEQGGHADEARAQRGVPRRVRDALEVTTAEEHGREAERDENSVGHEQGEQLREAAAHAIEEPGRGTSPPTPRHLPGHLPLDLAPPLTDPVEVRLGPALQLLARPLLYRYMLHEDGDLYHR